MYMLLVKTSRRFFLFDDLGYLHAYMAFYDQTKQRAIHDIRIVYRLKIKTITYGVINV